VSTGLPDPIYDLMRLYPQPVRRTRCVEYLPSRHDRPAAEQKGDLSYD